MTSLRFASLWAICFACGAALAGQPTELAPSPLEAFAARPTAAVTWSKNIGHLKSRYAEAVFTVVIVEDRTASGMMRGLRIDLSHAGETPGCDWKYAAWRAMCLRKDAAVWVAEDRLESVRDGIARGAAELRPFEFISRYGSHDASGRPSGGIIVCGYDFPDLSSTDLTALFAHAMGEIKEAPR